MDQLLSENNKKVSPTFVDFLKRIIDLQRIEMEKIAKLQLNAGITVVVVKV